MTKSYRAIAFDTGGTVLDWHTSLLNEVRQIQVWGPLAFDRHEFANTWRRNAMKAIVGQIRPTFNMDDVHWDALGKTITAFNLPLPNQDIMDRLWRGWHRLRAWPDLPPALRRLSLRAPVVSFTMLPISLIVNVSRLNGLSWDAVISCEVIGVYKPNQQAYQTAAQWLAPAPDDILMVACHNFDLNAAQDAGYKTAFVKRPHEWGPAGPPDPHPNRDYDFVCDSFSELADLI